MRFLSTIEAFGSRGFRITLISLGVVCFLIVALLIASLFTNGLIRGRIQRAMNEKLVGYHSQLDRARLNLLDGDLTLMGVTVVQNAYPNPPVMRIGSITAHIDWPALFSGHIVAGLDIKRPHMNINLRQLMHESHNKVPVSKEGWQDAV